jgi:nitrilase
MKATLKVAAIQMVSAASLNQNLEAAARLIAQAAQDGAHLVGLPE